MFTSNLIMLSKIAFEVLAWEKTYLDGTHAKVEELSFNDSVINRYDKIENRNRWDNEDLNHNTNVSLIQFCQNFRDSCDDDRRTLRLIARGEPLHEAVTTPYKKATEKTEAIQKAIDEFYEVEDIAERHGQNLTRTVTFLTKLYHITKGKKQRNTYHQAVYPRPKRGKSRAPQ